MNIIKILKKLYKSKNEHFLSVDYEFYKKWKFIIRFILTLNKNYVPCEIFRKKYKLHNNIVIIGLKWYGKNVKRRTSGFAKQFLKISKKPKCIFCEMLLTNENATCDHIIPISEGGNNSQVNIIVTCRECNNERGIIPFYDYLKMKNEKYKLTKIIFI